MLLPLPQKDQPKASQAKLRAPSNAAYLPYQQRIPPFINEQLIHANADRASFKHANTPAKAKNKELITSDHRFSHLLSIMPAGVLVLDKKGAVTLANQQAKILLEEPLVGETWRDVISRVFTPKADDGHEVSMRNGKRVKIDISPLTEEKGQLIVITDLTETRQLQSRVGHMQRLSSLGKMVASLAHQVRTPLSSALLYAENLKAMPLNNNIATQFSEKLTLRLKELESQVNDMLLFAKSSDNQIVTPLSIQQIQNQAIAQVEAQIKQANIKFQVLNNLDHALNASSIECHILGNITAISGALTNLITNAMQAHPHVINSAQCAQIPTITFNITQENITHKNTADQAYCVFSVIDNGKGLEKDRCTHIFEPFYTTRSQGTGLGLAVVNTVAKSHKGFVKCGNNPDKGAFFSLYLPLSTAHCAASTTQQADTSSRNPQFGDQQSLGVTHE